MPELQLVSMQSDQPPATDSPTLTSGIFRWVSDHEIDLICSLLNVRPKLIGW
jgi:hypothetical protein